MTSSLAETSAVCADRLDLLYAVKLCKYTDATLQEDFQDYAILCSQSE